jgi:TPR repeat protein/uncharacterized caspase-like protein
MGVAGAQQAPTRVALVIANATYAGYPSLPNTKVDAGLVVDALRRAGFSTEMRTDLDGDATRVALAQFRTRATGAQVALVYFAGHGMESGGKNWMLPVGAQLTTTDDLEFNAIESSLFVQATAGARARVIVLDACRNNPLAVRMRGVTRAASVGLAPPRDGVRGTLYMYSAAPGEEAQDGPAGQGSPFARAFARYIVTPGLDLRRAAGEVSEAVYRETAGAQTPFQTSSLSGEEIVFVPAPVVSVAPRTVLAADASASALGAEAAAFEVASKLWSVAGWQEFLRLHPDGERSALARQALASLQPAPTQATRPMATTSPAAAPVDPLAPARRAVEAITPAEWNAAEFNALVTRVVSSSSRDALEKLAAQGNARAQVLAGAAYRVGWSGFPKNENEAWRLFRLAAAQGDARGQYLMGVAAYTGVGGATRNEAEAARLYRLAADQGNAFGQVSLGALYDYGAGGLRQDKVEAVRWYQLAATQGNAYGMVYLGLSHRDGDGGLAVNETEAVRLFRLAAAQGNSLAQLNLAFMYLQGRGGLRPDDAEAARLYRLAADQGEADAQATLATLYLDGRGVTRNEREAARLYALAAAQGNAAGQAGLGKMNVNGEGGLHDRAEGIRLLRLAAAQGHEWARNALAQIGAR